MRINFHNFAHRIRGSGRGMRNSYRRASAEYLIDAVIAMWVGCGWLGQRFGPWFATVILQVNLT